MFFLIILATLEKFKFSKQPITLFQDTSPTLRYSVSKAPRHSPTLPLYDCSISLRSRGMYFSGSKCAPSDFQSVTCSKYGSKF